MKTKSYFKRLATQTNVNMDIQRAVMGFLNTHTEAVHIRVIKEKVYKILSHGFAYSTFSKAMAELCRECIIHRVQHGVYALTKNRSDQKL